jgi:hypothetical protein
LADTLQGIGQRDDRTSYQLPVSDFGRSAVDAKRLVIALAVLAVLVGGYLLVDFVLFDQILFAQKQLGDPSAFERTPAAAPVRPAVPARPEAPVKEYAVWFRVSGDSPEARVTYTDSSGEKGGVVVAVPWQVSSVAREGDAVVLTADNQTAKDLVAEIYIAERGPGTVSDDPPPGAVPWQRATVGSYGVGRCEGVAGK